MAEAKPNLQFNINPSIFKHGAQQYLSMEPQITLHSPLPQPNDKLRDLLRLMSSCPMSFAHVSRLASRVKPRDGNGITPIGQVKSNQDCFLREGMRRET